MTIQKESIQLVSLKGEESERMQEYVESNPIGAYEELKAHYDRVRSDHHLLEPAYLTLCKLWPGNEIAGKQIELRDLKAARKSAMNLVSWQFRRLIDVDYPPEVG